MQKLTYVEFPNQLFKCRKIRHMAKDCMWQNVPHGNSMEKFKDKVATNVVDNWTTVRKGKVLLAKNVELSNKWVPIGNRFKPIDALNTNITWWMMF